MDQTRLDELIEKYASGTITLEELQELLDWYRSEEIEAVEWPAGSPDERDQLQQRMLQRLNTQIRAGQQTPDLPMPGTETPGQPMPDKQRPGASIIPLPRLLRLRGWHIAASLIVIFSAIWVARQYLDITGHPIYITVRNPSGKIQAIRLPDSSQAWLNASSSIRYAQTFDKKRDAKREIFLEGEGYFDVTTDPTRPFVVHAGPITTIVLGTSFDIKFFAGERQASISVIRGKVQVGDSTRILDVLTPARQLQVDTRTGQAHTITVDTNMVVSWQQGKLQFAGQTMEEIAASLGRWYNVQFTFADPAIGHCRYYLNFENTISLEKLLAILKETTDLSYQFDEDRRKVTLSGNACQ